MSSFYFNGLLDIPEGVTIVWSDDGTGMVVDGDKVRLIKYINNIIHYYLSLILSILYYFIYLFIYL